MCRIILCEAAEAAVLPEEGKITSDMETPEEGKTIPGMEGAEEGEAASDMEGAEEGKATSDMEGAEEGKAASGMEEPEEEKQAPSDMKKPGTENKALQGKDYIAMTEKPEAAGHPIVTGSMAVILVLLTIALTLLIQKLMKRKRRLKGNAVQPTEATETAPLLVLPEGQPERTDYVKVGKLHNIGKRGTQQDSFGVADIYGGVLAVVADGMGGLSDGDKVSQKIVRTMLQDAARLKQGYKEEYLLYQMLSNANQEVLRMCRDLDSSRSGSTVVAVLAEKDSFHWISVGDSRIYLFRDGRLVQVNKDHIYERELLQKAVNKEIAFSEVQADKQRKRVTSFIGMGRLKYVDGSLYPVGVKKGDKVLLMTDGVFHTLSEQEICMVLAESENAGEAAAIMEQRILTKQHPKQDNFTMVILDFLI